MIEVGHSARESSLHGESLVLVLFIGFEIVPFPVRTGRCSTGQSKIGGSLVLRFKVDHYAPEGSGGAG